MSNTSNERGVLMATEIMIRSAAECLAIEYPEHGDVAADVIEAAEEMAGRRQELCAAAGVDFVNVSSSSE